MSESNLRTALEDHFNREELEQLCADLQALLAERGIDIPVGLDQAGGDSYPAQVLALVRYLKRRNLLNELADAIKRERPGILGPPADPRLPAPPPSAPARPDNMEGVITLILVVTMCLVIVLVGAAVCALVWAQVLEPVFLYLTIVLVVIPAALVWKRRSQPHFSI